MAVWRADPKRRGQFVAGHARLQRWIFRLEISRHQDEGVMVPVGVWRCARPPIGVLFHRALAADKFLRFLAKFALGKSLHVAGNAVNHHVDDPGRRPAFGVEHDYREALRAFRRARPSERRRNILPDAVRAALFVGAGVLDCQLVGVLQGRRSQHEHIGPRSAKRQGQSAGKQQTAQSIFHDVLPLGSLSYLPVPAGSGHGTVLVKDATASPHSKARQILVTFHDTLPRRGPTQPTIGLTVISGYGGSFALLLFSTTVPSLIISRTFLPGGLWRLPMPPQQSLLSRVGAVPCWGGSCHSFRQLLGRGVRALASDPPGQLWDPVQSSVSRQYRPHHAMTE